MKRGLLEDGITRGRRKHLGVMDMLITLIALTVSWLCTCLNLIKLYVNYITKAVKGKIEAVK